MNPSVSSIRRYAGGTSHSRRSAWIWSGKSASSSDRGDTFIGNRPVIQFNPLNGRPAFPLMRTHVGDRALAAGFVDKVGPGIMYRDGRAKAIRTVCEASLKQLKLETIDLLQLHLRDQLVGRMRVEIFAFLRLHAHPDHAFLVARKGMLEDVGQGLDGEQRQATRRQPRRHGSNRRIQIAEGDRTATLNVVPFNDDRSMLAAKPVALPNTT